MKPFAMISTIMILGAASANAAEPTFSYSRSELANSASRADLYQRLEDEAARSCAFHQASGLYGVEYRKFCTAQLVEEYVEKIDDSALTALHFEKSESRLASY